MSSAAFVFKVFAKNPPSILFVLAALGFLVAEATQDPNAWTFTWACLILGVILQVLWLFLMAGRRGGI